MKNLIPIIILLATFVSVSSARQTETLEFQSKINFADGEDRILQYKLVEDEKILLIGEKHLQIWDVRNSTLISSVTHQIPQFAPRGIFSTSVLLSLPQILDLMKPFIVDLKGNYIVIVEKVGNNKLRSVVVRDLKTLAQIAVLDLPGVSADYLNSDDQARVISAFGQTNDTRAIAEWDADTFELKKLVLVDEYKWHRFISNDEQMIVGAGETIPLWGDNNIKQGESLTLRDVKTGDIVKEFTAQNLIPRTTYQNTAVSKDEKYLLSSRDDRVFVWGIQGDGSPKFEVSAKSENKDHDFVRVVGGKVFAVSVDKDLHIYNIAGAGAPQFILVSPTPNDSVKLFDQTDDGKIIVVADDSRISVLETGGMGKPIFEIDRENENERFTLIKFIESMNALAVGRINRSEQKPERTELYDINTGKLIEEIPIGFTSNVKVSPGGESLFDDRFGSTAAWHFGGKQTLYIPLKTYQPESKPGDISQESPSNLEFTSLSPNGKFVLKFGDDVVSVFEIETGKEIQKLFDAERAKYDKKNQIKKSGLGNAFWSDDGKRIFAIGEKSRTVSFWKFN